ncbi:MAG: RNA 2'-phosphotransferase [Anaerolineae bacterium]
MTGNKRTMGEDLVRVSKFLSWILRHDPQEIGVTLDEGGWVEVEALMDRARQAGVALDEATLRRVAAGDDKQRFSLSEDGQRLRANYGHSIPVDLGLPPAAPPEHLYHGTARHFLASIRGAGLARQGRNYVHLSPDEDTARRVGRRHGEPVVLVVEAGRMHRQGHLFYCATDGTWLTDGVPVDYLCFPPADGDRRKAGAGRERSEGAIEFSQSRRVGVE